MIVLPAEIKACGSNIPQALILSGKVKEMTDYQFNAYIELRDKCGEQACELATLHGENS